MARVEVLLKTGETALILKSDGDTTVLESPRSSPPGSTVLGRVVGIESELHLKVARCRKVGESFQIEGRLRNAPRDLKAVLVTAGRD